MARSVAGSAETCQSPPGELAENADPIDRERLASCDSCRSRTLRP